MLVFDSEKSEKVRKTKVSWLKEKDLTSKYPLLILFKTQIKKQVGIFNYQVLAVSIFYI